MKIYGNYKILCPRKKQDKHEHNFVSGDSEQCCRQSSVNTKPSQTYKSYAAVIHNIDGAGVVVLLYQDFIIYGTGQAFYLCPQNVVPWTRTNLHRLKVKLKLPYI